MLYRSNAEQDEFRLSQAALLCMSSVRGYVHVCSMWSATKKQIRVIKQQLTHQTHFLF